MQAHYGRSPPERFLPAGQWTRFGKTERKDCDQPAAFWDASALMPLCVREATTNQVRQYLRRFAPVVWWGSIVEVHSAIARLHREAAIAPSERDGALARLTCSVRAGGKFSRTTPCATSPEHFLIPMACGLRTACNLRQRRYGAGNDPRKKHSSAVTNV